MSRLLAVAAVALLPALVHAQDETDPHKGEPIVAPDRPFAPAPTTPVPLGGADADLMPGDPAPNFTFDTSAGGQLRRRDLHGHWSVLVFDASRKTLAPIDAIADSTTAIGVVLYGVCGDGPDALRHFAAERHLREVLLADPTGQLSQLFGMYDDVNRAIQPGLVMVDPTGTIRMVLQGPTLHAADVWQMVSHTVRGS